MAPSRSCQPPDPPEGGAIRRDVRPPGTPEGSSAQRPELRSVIATRLIKTEATYTELPVNDPERLRL
jgi:hypothetical protein